MSLSKPNDFARDVLEGCKKRNIKLHGQPPWYLEYKPNGDLKMWFYGQRNDRPWAGGFTIIRRDDISNAYIRGDSNAFVEALEQAIDHAQVRIK